MASEQGILGLAFRASEASAISVAVCLLAGTTGRASQPEGEWSVQEVLAEEGLA